MDTTPDFSLATVLLAAGRSVRMGRPKLLLSWGSTSILGHLIRQWQTAGIGQIAVVCGDDDEPMHAELERLAFPQEHIIKNRDTDEGMFSSVLCAARWPGWRSSISHWAFALGDQPHLRQSTVASLVNFAERHPNQICQPTQDGRRGHPVLLPKSALVELRATKAANLKEFLTTQDVAVFACDDPGLLLDIDRPEDYAKALVLAGFPSA